MTAKDLELRTIDAATARALVKRVHYSGKVVNNSQLHISAFYSGRLEGVMQFGPSLDKRKILGLVEDTPWNGMLELNRMAFTDALPRNSESRALAVAMRIIRKHAPHVQWVVTFADGCQCGDGTIYRAAGFHLVGIKKNNQIWQFPGGEVATILVATDTRRPQRGRLLASAGATFSRVTTTKGGHITETGGASMRQFIEAGAVPLPGFQLKYIYFLDPTARARLTVPILPFSAIDAAGARMYKGNRASEPTSVGTGDQPGKGGATPTRTLEDEAAP